MLSSSHLAYGCFVISSTSSSCFATSPRPLALHSRLYPPRRATTCRTLRAAALLFWYGIAVLPCFSASGKVPVTRWGLPLRGTYAAYCPQPPAPKSGLSREEEMKRQGCRSPVTPSAPLMLIYFFQMLPFLVQLFAKSLNIDIRRILFLDCALLELAAFAMAGKWASPFFCSCNTSRNGRLINAKLICYLAHAPTALKV